MASGTVSFSNRLAEQSGIPRKNDTCHLVDLNIDERLVLFTMDFDKAIVQVIDDAERIVLPGAKVDIVTQIRRDFAKLGYCGGSVIEMVWDVLRKRLARWTLDEKREIWESLKDIGDVDGQFDDYLEDSVDTTLENELMYLITEELSPPDQRFRDDSESEY